MYFIKIGSEVKTKIMSKKKNNTSNNIKGDSSKDKRSNNVRKNKHNDSPRQQKSVNNKVFDLDEKIVINYKDEADIEKSINSYEDYISQYVEGFVTKMYSDGVLKTVDSDTLKEWLSNPDTYYNEISNLMTYYYITDGDVFQQYDLFKTLPNLSYKIREFSDFSQNDNSKKNEKNISTINKALYKISYKQLVRDIISQELAKGTVVGMWLGDKKNPYFFVFDSLKYVFPKYRLNGSWVCVCDMEWFKDMKEEERAVYFKNLSPYVTKTDYNRYLKNSDKYRYKELPQDRTACLRVNTLFRNQRLGLSMGTQTLFDKMHKQTLKNLETAIANQIIKNIVVVKIGSEKNTDYANMKLKKGVKQKIYNGVKKALNQSMDKGISVITVPEFVDVAFGEVKGLDGFKKDKFEPVNDDITNALGISRSLTNGNGGNYATGKLNLEILHKKIGVLLEDIETEVFTKLLKILLPSTQADNYFIEFDKEVPLTNKEKIDVLKGLHSEGFAVKPILDCIQGIDYVEYIKQSIYEIESLKLRERIIPPSLSFTTSGSEQTTTKPTDDNPDNNNTIVSKDNDANNTPRAGV